MNATTIINVRGAASARTGGSQLEMMAAVAWGAGSADPPARLPLRPRTTAVHLVPLLFAALRLILAGTHRLR